MEFMQAKQKIPIFLILFTLFVDVMGFGIIIPVLPKLIRELTGGSISEASQLGGWLMFAFSFPLFLFSPFMGSLSDRFGRRPILLISLFGLCLDSLLQGFAPSMIWLFVGRTLSGVMGASFSIVYSYIADITTQEERAEKFGLLGAAFGMGFIVGPILGGLLGPFGSRVPFFVAAGISFLNCILAFFFLPESLSEENKRPFELKRANPIGSLMNLKKYPSIYGLLFVLLLLNISHQAVRTTWTFYVSEKFSWDEKTIGYSLAMIGLMYAFVQGGLITPLLNLFGRNLTIYIGFVFYIIGNILFGIATEGWMMFLFVIPYALGGMEEPPLQSLISSKVAENEQGQLQGTIMSIISISAIIGPVLMSEVFAYFTKPTAPIYLPGAPLFLSAVLTLGCLISVYFSLRKDKSGS